MAPLFCVWCSGLCDLSLLVGVEWHLCVFGVYLPEDFFFFLRILRIFSFGHLCIFFVCEVFLPVAPVFARLFVFFLLSCRVSVRPRPWSL